MSTALLIVGDLCSDTMEPVRTAIEPLVPPEFGVRCARNVADALREIASSENDRADLVIVCQHWPDEFTEREVRALFSRYPLARLVCCYGPWCDSDGRTRDVWPWAVRVPVDRALERIRRELDVIAGSRSPLPLTASREEILLFDA